MKETATSNRHRPRILCVDDEPQVLAGISDALRRHFDVTTAVGGAEGLRVLADDEPFIVVVSDFKMPGMNGAQFLAQARILAPDTIRVLLTGQASLTDAVDAVNDGKIFRFLMKPCSPVDLVRALDDAVEQARLVTADRRLLERKLESMSHHLRRAERLASLGTLAGAVGHELNNVLTVFVSSLDAIREDVASGRLPATEDLEALGRVQGHLTTHAENLLHLGRPPAEAKDPPVTDLAKTIRAVLDMLIAAGTLRRVQVGFQWPERPVEVRIPGGELEQVFVNLLTNAVDATEGVRERAPRIDITWATSDDGQYVVCRVADNGTGIPRDNLPFIFEPYFTTKSSARGTGLGLFVVRQIVEQRGGEVAIDSEDGHGTTLMLRLPVAAVAVHDAGHGGRVARVP
jgi:signal transduction histidine kinase